VETLVLLVVVDVLTLDTGAVCACDVETLGCVVFDSSAAAAAAAEIDGTTTADGGGGGGAGVVSTTTGGNCNKRDDTSHARAHTPGHNAPLVAAA
jgi:hypothetical protein